MSETQQDTEQELKKFRALSRISSWKKLSIIFMFLVLHKDQSAITDKQPFTWKDLNVLILIKIIVYIDILSDAALNIVNLPCDWILLNEHVAETFNYDPHELFIECRHGKYRLHYSIISGFFSGIFWYTVINTVHNLFK